jgi:hypothetical protein
MINTELKQGVGIAEHGPLVVVTHTPSTLISTQLLRRRSRQLGSTKIPAQTAYASRITI